MRNAGNDNAQLHFAATRLTTGPRLDYAGRSDREGEAIIFLHGYSDLRFSFSGVLHLSSPEHHAFALTQHGESDKPDCCYTGDDFTADVDAFMHAAGIEKATVVDHSGDGFIARHGVL